MKTVSLGASRPSTVYFRMPTRDNLVPIRVDVEVDGQRYRDAFTWNPRDPDSEIISFAKRTAKDLKLPANFVPQMLQSIQGQLAEFRSYEGQEMQIKEKIVPLKIDLRVNNTVIRDQFLWDISNLDSDPEEFVRTLCDDLNITDPEVGPAIAVSIREQLYEVTVLVNDHTCVSSMRMATTTPNCKWVALWAASILRAEPNIGARELQKRLETDHKCEIAYDTVWRGKAKALDEVYGKWSESFQLLYRWKAEVEKRSPGSVVEIDVLEVDGEVYFHRFFCALKPCIDGFLEGCRPHLSIDATALNGRWNGHLAAAVAVDGHNWMYPVAYGFIASETTVNWTWFMEQLKKAIGDPPLLAICSDACKGLENAVNNVFPNAEQRECFYHLARNFKKRFRGFVQIYPAARAYREEIFYDNLAKMLSESSEAVQWLQANHKLLWYRCGFNPDIKCDYITSNIAESFNNWIRDHKDLPVADLADKIREMIMVLWHKRRIIAYRLPEGRILPAIMVQLRANTRGLGHLKIVKCSNWSAEVWDHSSGVSVRHIVKLEQRTCTCQEWQHTGKPCQHVLAYVTRQRGIDLEQFVHDYYSVNRFRAAYGREIEPMTDKTQWPEVDLPFLVGAPLAKLPPGRLRKLRIKGWMEGGHKKKGSKDEKFSNEMEGEKGCDNDTAPTNAKGKKMIRGPMTCKRCGEKGHRQASFKCPLNGTAKKRKRRQPRKNVTIQPAEPSTPRRLTREEILRDSPGRVTRSMLATLLGEGTSSQVDTNSPVRMPTAAAPKKMTPKRKLHIG